MTHYAMHIILYSAAKKKSYKSMIHKMRSIVCNLHPQQVSPTIVEYDYKRKQVSKRSLRKKKVCIQAACEEQ